MKCIPVQEAVGAILCHDITQIPGNPGFHKVCRGNIGAGCLSADKQWPGIVFHSFFYNKTGTLSSFLEPEFPD